MPGLCSEKSRLQVNTTSSRRHEIVQSEICMHRSTCLEDRPQRGVSSDRVKPKGSGLSSRGLSGADRVCQTRKPRRHATPPPRCAVFRRRPAKMERKDEGETEERM